MGLMKAILATAGLLITPIAMGDVVITLPEDIGQMPNYWSGTGCRAWATVQVVGQPGDPSPVQPTITSARLYIGGQLVEEVVSATPQGPFLFGATLDVRWDSTHFNSGASINLRVEVDEYGDPTPTVRTSQSLPVRNKALAAVLSFVQSAPPPNWSSPSITMG